MSGRVEHTAMIFTVFRLATNFTEIVIFFAIFAIFAILVKFLVPVEPIQSRINKFKLEKITNVT